MSQPSVVVGRPSILPIKNPCRLADGRLAEGNTAECGLLRDRECGGHGRDIGVDLSGRRPASDGLQGCRAREPWPAPAHGRLDGPGHAVVIEGCCDEAPALERFRENVLCVLDDVLWRALLDGLAGEVLRLIQQAGIKGERRRAPEEDSPGWLQAVFGSKGRAACVSRRNA